MTTDRRLSPPTKVLGCAIRRVTRSIILIAILSACSPREGVRVSLVLPATGTEFAGELRAGAEAAARDLDERVRLKIVGPAQIDPGEQVKAFQNEAATGPDAIIVGAIPPSMFAEPALQANRSGTTVAWIVAAPPPEIEDALFVGQREFDMGHRVGNLVADRIVAKRGEVVSGVIILGNCVPGLPNLEDRLLGARQALQSRLPNVRIPPTITDGNERAANFAVWQQAVAANPDGLAFLAACEPGMVNLAKIKQDDDRDFVLVAWDTPEQVRTSITQGVISAAVPPSHYLSAYTAVWTVANALLDGRSLPTGWIQTPITVIDVGNIDAFNVVSVPPSGLGGFFQSALEQLKAAPTDRLPAISLARPPATAADSRTPKTEKVEDDD